MNFDLLIIAGSLSLSAAVLHVCVVMGGARWYRFFGELAPLLWSSYFTMKGGLAWQEQKSVSTLD